MTRTSSMTSQKNTKSNDNNKNEKKQKRTKTVRFNEKPKVIPIPSVNDYSPEDIDAYYLTMDDMERIREENNYTLKRMRQEGSLPDDGIEYFRGLENEVRPYQLEKDERIDLAGYAILEQYNTYGVIDPVWIEEVYKKKFTSKATELSFEAASWDALAAEW
jgi:hypothetical protein